MAKKTSKSLNPEQVAQKAKPNWKPVPKAPEAAEDRGYAQTDSVTPELDALYRKYFGADATGARAVGKPTSAKRSKMVVMEAKNPADHRLGTKVVLVEGNKVVGEQG